METRSAEGTESVAGEILSFVHRLWLHKVMLISIMIPAMILAVIVAMLIPPRYEATAVLLPDMGQDTTSRLSGGLGSLASLAGVNIGGPGVDLYPVVGRSRRILEEVLRQEFEGETIGFRLNKDSEPDSLELYLVRKALRSSLSFSKDLRSDCVTLRYRNRDPGLAAAVVNSVVGEMEAYFADRARSDARTELALIGDRLREVTDELARAEEDLKMFREGNRSAARSPNLQLQEARLERNVEFRNRIYLELASQLELVKIQEAAASDPLIVLDHATRPLVKAWPPRLYVVLVIVGIVFVLSALWIQIRASRGGAGSGA